MKTIFISVLCLASGLASATGIPVVDETGNTGSGDCLHRGEGYTAGSTRKENSETFVCCPPNDTYKSYYWDLVNEIINNKPLGHCNSFKKDTYLPDKLP